MRNRFLGRFIRPTDAGGAGLTCRGAGFSHEAGTCRYDDCMTLRLVRPYASEEEFVRSEGATIGRGTMLLIGAPETPIGAIVRFEICISNGVALLRGEARVVDKRKYQAKDSLIVKLTRLDAASKQFLERLWKQREESSREFVNEDSDDSEPALSSMQTPNTPQPPVESAIEPVLVTPITQPSLAQVAHKDLAAAPADVPPASAQPSSGQVPAPSTQRSATPEGRNEMLQRLRKRTLTEAQRAAILSEGTTARAKKSS
jgi:hypothetical protein